MTDAELDQCRRNGQLLRSLVAERTPLKRQGTIWKCLCPVHDDHDPSCAVYDDGHWHCFACEAHGTVFDFIMAADKVEFREAAKLVAAAAGICEEKPNRPKTPPDKIPDLSRQPDWFYKFWAHRRIGEKTLAHFGVYGGNHPEIGSCIVFPYRKAGKLVNRKFRAVPDKIYRNDQGTEVTLFNADAIAPDKPLYLVEGEIDVMAMHEAGYPNCVSMRDGYNSNLDAFGLYADQLAKVPVFYLCGDADTSGDKWRERVSRRLGRHKCRIVSWPEGRKDASDTLRMAAEAEGPEDYDEVSIRTAIGRAAPIPLEGVREINLSVIEEAFARPIPPTMTTGLLALDNILRSPTEGKLIVGTGVPGHGKSSFMRFVAARTIVRHQRRWLAFVAEDDFDEYVIDMTMLVTGQGYHSITQEDRKAAALKLGDGSMRVLEFDAERKPPLIDTILERARESILSGGTTDLLIDPWNELEHQRGDATETDYIGRTLQRFRQFAGETCCNVWIMAHPAKIMVRPGEKRTPPTGSDISGSAHWFNKPDVGFTVWAPEKGQAEIRIWKSRRHRWATRGATATIDFDQSTGQYLEPIREAPPSERVASWVEREDA